MSLSPQFVLFRIDGSRYALPIGSVERVVSAVEVTVLPDAPTLVSGVIDVAGRVLPVLNLRLRFGLPSREIGPDDRFILARTARRSVALVVDEVLEVLTHPAAGITPPSEIVPGVSNLRGVVTLPDGLVLIHDLENFLSLDQAQALEAALGKEETNAI